MTSPDVLARPPDESETVNAGQDPDLLPAHLGPSELGRIEVSGRVVEKIAARTAAEVPDAGSPSARLLGRQLPGAGHIGIPGAALDRLPKVSADVDGQHAFIDVSLSVRWPAPIAEVTTAVRRRLTSQLSDLIGLHVQEINIDIVDLVTGTSTTRVQ